MKRSTYGYAAGALALALTAAGCGAEADAAGTGSLAQPVKPGTGSPSNSRNDNGNATVTIEQTREPGRRCGTKSCFRIESDRNITHGFLDFGWCPVEDFRVLLRTPAYDGFRDVTDRLKTNGGPCQSLGLEYRFEITGPDRVPGTRDLREAEICVVFEDKISEVTVGAKSANTCEKETFDEGLCKKCKKKVCKPSYGYGDPWETDGRYEECKPPPAHECKEYDYDEQY